MYLFSSLGMAYLNPHLAKYGYEIVDVWSSAVSANFRFALKVVASGLVIYLTIPTKEIDGFTTAHVAETILLYYSAKFSEGRKKVRSNLRRKIRI